MEIRKFFGDLSNWQSFWSQFESSIHENASLKQSDKLVYLRSFLGGVAERAIQGLSSTDENYENAVQVLRERFGRRDLVINAHMNKLLNMQPVSRSSDVGMLRKLYDACEVQIRSLAALGVASDTYGNLLCPVLMKLVPSDIALELSRKRKADEEWKVLDLLNLLRIEVESRERAHQLTTGQGDIELPKGFSRPVGNYKQSKTILQRLVCM